MVLDLSLLLEAEGIEANKVLALRHRPTEPKLRKAFQWLAQDHPELFNAYQRTHGLRTEASLLQAKFAASFIGHEPSKAVFVGLYTVDGSVPISRTSYLQDGNIRALIELGMSPWDIADARQTALRFDLKPTEALARLKGRLVVNWPAPDRSWFRWADPKRNLFPILAIHEDNILAPDVVPWQEIKLGWKELKVLPARWRSALSQWRGIYYIFDALDGKAYVGSAYGSENLLGRWLNYSASGHGGNHHLLGRDPANFTFSILQRVSPDMPGDEIIAIESSWKARLHTAHPLGLNGN